MSLSLRTLLLASTTLATLASGYAEDIRVDAATAPTTEVGKYQLKNRSTFTLPPETRAPFWPIGWVKGKPSPTQLTTGPRMEVDERSFNVTSILLGNPSLAIISGRTYSEGEMLKMPSGRPAAKVRVMRIADGAVTVQHEDQVIVLALRRAELVGKKPPAELNSDR